MRTPTCSSFHRRRRRTRNARARWQRWQSKCKNKANDEKSKNYLKIAFIVLLMRCLFDARRIYRLRSSLLPAMCAHILRTRKFFASFSIFPLTSSFMQRMPHVCIAEFSIRSTLGRSVGRFRNRLSVFLAEPLAALANDDNDFAASSLRDVLEVLRACDRRIYINIKCFAANFINSPFLRRVHQLPRARRGCDRQKKMVVALF